MKKTLVSLFVGIFSTLAIIAQTQIITPGSVECPPGYTCSSAIPSFLPLGSPKILEAYALTLVKQITVQVGGQTVSGDHYKWVQYTNLDANPDRMAEMASQVKLNPTMSVDDNLNSYIGYQTMDMSFVDQNGEKGTSLTTSFTLFYGQTHFKLVNPTGSRWVIPEEAYHVQMKVSQVPFVIPGMKDAYMITTNGSGNVGFFNFRTENEWSAQWVKRGVLMLTDEMTSRAGKLIVTLNDDTKITYNLGSGQLQEIVKSEVQGFRPNIPGFRSVQPNSSEIEYQDTDEMLITSYTVTKSVRIKFPQGLTRYPYKVSIIATRTLAEYPLSNWLEFNPFVQEIIFQGHEGIDYFIRFDYAKDPQLINNSPGSLPVGKG